MIVLSSTSDILRIVTSAALALDVNANYVDSNINNFLPNRQNTTIATATTTTVLSSPASGFQRALKGLTACARGGANTITVEYFDGTNAFRLFSVLLGTGEWLEYEDANGWCVFGSDGSRKTLLVESSDVQTFSGPGSYTWIKPARAKRVSVYVFPVGGPGGSGRKQTTAATAAFGGGAGASGFPRVGLDLDAGMFADTETVVIGADSVGGAAQTTNDTNGNAGTVGGTTSFGSLPFLSAPAAAAGSGGTTTGGAAGTVSQGFFGVGQQAAANSGTGGTAAAGNGSTNATTLSSTGAAGGGGVTAIGGVGNGGSVNSGHPIHGALAGGTVGAGQDGQDGADSPSVTSPIGGQGGSGGAGNATGANAGRGGHGGFPSGGGAGGGGAFGGGNSGPGGDGGGALVIVITTV